MKLTLTKIKQLEGDAKSFTFSSEKPISWEAGQFLHITLKHSNPDDRGEERWFTISSAPSQEEITISTRVISERRSSFKEALLSLKPGEQIEADQPEGDFTLDDIERNYIFVAGGIGITPFHSIITEAVSKKTIPNITMLYANKDKNVAFQEELDKISQSNPNLKIEYIYSPEKIDKENLRATIDKTENPIVYVSGPEPMVEAFEKDLQELGLKKESIKTDFFPGYESF